MPSAAKSSSSGPCTFSILLSRPGPASLRDDSSSSMDAQKFQNLGPPVPPPRHHVDGENSILATPSPPGSKLERDQSSTGGGGPPSGAAAKLWTSPTVAGRLATERRRDCCAGMNSLGRASRAPWWPWFLCRFFWCWLFFWLCCFF